MNRLLAIEEAERLNSAEEKPKGGSFEIVYSETTGEWSTEFTKSGSTKGETGNHAEQVDSDVAKLLPIAPATDTPLNDGKGDATPTVEDELPADKGGDEAPKTAFTKRLEDGKLKVHTKHDEAAKNKNR